MIRPVLISAALAFAFSASAHTDASLEKNGCHKGKRQADYHCHEGLLKDRRFKSKEDAQKALIRARITPKNQSNAGRPDPDIDPS